MFLLATRQIETHRSKRLRVKGFDSRGSILTIRRSINQLREAKPFTLFNRYVRERAIIGSSLAARRAGK
jgi:hypothetical protein